MRGWLILSKGRYNNNSLEEEKANSQLVNQYLRW